MGKRIKSRRRGKGSPLYRAPSHKYSIKIKYPAITEGAGKVINIEHDRVHTSPVAVVKMDDLKFYMFAHNNMYIGQDIMIGPGADIKPGNILPLGYIPDGTAVYNVELRPFDGGKLVRAAGTYAQVVAHGEKARLVLPSGQTKLLDPRCRAVIGETAGAGRTDKPFLKAGTKIRAYRSKAKKTYTVRGVAMNAVNHPHGGGNHQHVGRPSTVSKNAPPGRKVGRIAKKRKKTRRR